MAELKKAFQDSVDDYLAFCKERGEEPEKPFSGQFVVRAEPELHRAVVTAAKRAGGKPQPLGYLDIGARDSSRSALKLYD